MRIEALHARIQRQGRAVFAAGFLDDPVEKLSAEAVRTIGLARYQIIDV